MTLTVLAIAVVPAALVATVAVRTKNRLATGAAGAVAAIIGLSTGSPHYAALDLSAVVIATFIFWPKASAAEQKATAAQQQPASRTSILPGLIVSILLLAIILAVFTSSPSTVPAVSRNLPDNTPTQRQAETPILPSKTPLIHEEKRSVGSARPLDIPKQKQRESTTPVINDGYKLRAAPNGNIMRQCEYKGVMTDDDYRACGVNPPR